MWIFLSDAFLSIVEDRDNADRLLVRGRHRGDIERVFPDAVVGVGEGSDYKYRAFLPRDVVAAALAREVQAIHYPNFKSSVKDRKRHEACMDVWEVMSSYQQEE